MKFAHLADIHIGAWRDPKMKEVCINSFCQAIDTSINENVDFVLISGDLFNTAIPPLDAVKIVFSKLKLLKDKGIRLYFIAGSHDFSATGKTMLDIIEEAGLGTNVCIGESINGKLRLRFVTDPSGVKITGMIGKKGGLDKEYYNHLDLETLENEPGEKIFMFHNAIAELRTSQFEKIEAVPLSLFPKGFKYYAGGHIHIIEDKEIEEYGKIVFPGPTFPCNFEEIERLKCGSFFIIDNWTTKKIEISKYTVANYTIDCDKLAPEEVSQKVKNTISDCANKIVTIRFSGRLREGKTSQIDFNTINETLSNAFFVMRNVSKLTSPEFENVKVMEGAVDEIETKLIQENVGQSGMDPAIEISLVTDLMNSLSSEKAEGETNPTYENRVVLNAKKSIL